MVYRRPGHSGDGVHGKEQRQLLGPGRDGVDDEMPAGCLGTCRADHPGAVARDGHAVQARCTPAWQIARIASSKVSLSLSPSDNNICESANSFILLRLSPFQHRDALYIYIRLYMWCARSLQLRRR